MKNFGIILCVALGVSLLALGCSTSEYQKTEQQMNMPINCATAEGDIRMLTHEKAHVEDQILQGVESITPAGFVVGMVTGTEGTKLQVTTGDYNKMIDRRIQEIKDKCGM